MLPSYFEGPSHLTNVTIKDNVFQAKSADATIESILETKASGAKCCDITGLSYSGNRVLKPPPPPPPTPSPSPLLPPAERIAGWSAFSNIDITLGNDSAYGGLCTNEAIVQTSSVWETSGVTALCDLLNCPRFGRFGGNGRPNGKPPPPNAGYCIKGWGGQGHGHPTHSYLSQSRCGGGIAAQTINGSCNRPSARYTYCPSGAGTTQVISQIPGRKTAAQVAVACEHAENCVGFNWAPPDGNNAKLLGYGLKGIGPYTGFASYTRIPDGD